MSNALAAGVLETAVEITEIPLADDEKVRAPRTRWPLGEPEKSCPRPMEAVIGTLVGRAASGEPLVDYAGNPHATPLPARSIVTWEDKNIGREAVLWFEQGDAAKPIVMGFVQAPRPATHASGGRADSVEAEIDGQKLVLAAGKEVVLRCGKASITLTRAGKVIIHGEYVLSRSSGLNSIQGASVQIN